MRSTVPRPFTLFAKEYFSNQKLIGVEIGVCEAINALSLLEVLNIFKLFLVDPYAPYVTATGAASFVSVGKFTVAVERLQAYADKIEWIKKKLWDAAAEIPDNLDFVYVDGNHSYDAVTRDLALYYPKVRGGGLIGGHDFTEQFPSVIHAVVEFSQFNEIPLHFNVPDWWLIGGDPIK